MEQFIYYYSLNLLAPALLMFCGWLYSLKARNVTIADSLWGPGFVLIAWISFFSGEGFLYRKIILVTLVTLWGLRLFIHLFSRSRGKAEDERYAQWRKEHGDSFWIVSLYKVFLVQALFQWLISMSMQYGQNSLIPAELTIFDFIGLGIWIAGFVIESSADHQLKSFLAAPANRGRVMKEKLWKYTRHPNYFGESMMWWGIFIIVLSVPGGIWTFFSPVIITYTLLRITGVTLMEEKIFGDNEEYRNYVKETSSFIPWFPKR